jgi:hypothetical protein
MAPETFKLFCAGSHFPEHDGFDPRFPRTAAAVWFSTGFTVFDGRLLVIHTGLQDKSEERTQSPVDYSARSQPNVETPAVGKVNVSLTCVDANYFDYVEFFARYAVRH